MSMDVALVARAFGMVAVPMPGTRDKANYTALDRCKLPPGTNRFRHERGYRMLYRTSRVRLWYTLQPGNSFKQTLRISCHRFASKSPSHSKPSPWTRTRDYLTTPSDNVAKFNTRMLRFVSGGLAAWLAGHIFLEYFFICEGAWGISMLPTIASSGDWLIISKYYRKGRGVGVGDVVSFRQPTVEGEYAVKRVIGMPGDFVLRDTPGHGSMMIQVPVGHCWVVGDNLTWSRDSRVYGPLPLALVNGKVLAKFSASAIMPQRIQHGLQPAVLDEEEVD